jgi:hypothetical protein
MQKLDRRVGTPDGFGLLVSVTSSTFEGLRHLHEVGEERNEKFSKCPHDRVMKELAELDRQVSSLQTADRWAEEATELKRLNHQLAHAVNEPQNKTVLRLVAFCHKFTAPGSAIPGDILSREVTQLQNSVLALESGGQSCPHTQVGFDLCGNQQGSTAQLNSMLAGSPRQRRKTLG